MMSSSPTVSASLIPHPLTPSILRKTDSTLLPFLSLLFLLNSLDRSNIGNAETAGYTHDIGLTPEDLNYAVAVFFAFFVSLQPLGAALGKSFGAHKYVPAVMVGWGIMTMAGAWVRGRYGVMTLRAGLGILEAGFYPTTVHYLSTFYTRYEFAQRLGLFYGQYAVAGAFGGVFSSIVFWLFPSDPDSTTPTDGASSGWKSWQILFILQGGMTLIVASIAWRFMPAGPGSAWWLEKGEEQKVAAERIWMDRAVVGTREDITDPDDLPRSSPPSRRASPTQNYSTVTPEHEGLLSTDFSSSPPPHTHSRLLQYTPPESLTKQDILEGITDPKVYFILLINILSSIPSTAFGIFLPLVLKSLGYAHILANLLTVPPFLLGATTLYLLSKKSDQSHQRIRFVLFGLLISLIGLLGVSLTSNSDPTNKQPGSWTQYIFLCILLSGSYIASPLTVAWITNNVEEPGKRAIVLGINGWGNLAGLLAPAIFSPVYAPSYKVPFMVTFVTTGVSMGGYWALKEGLERENERRKGVLGAWTAEERERERKFGLGPTGGGRGEAEEGRGRRFVRSLLGEGKWGGGLDMEGGGSGGRSGRRSGRVGRRGDEKVTYVYGL